MPVLRATLGAAICCALLVVGCRDSRSDCPEGTVGADPYEIPNGRNETALTVDVYNPNEANGLGIVTRLSAVAGAIEDPFALATTYACAHDWTGPIEICVETTYTEDRSGNPIGSQVPNVEGSLEYIRRSHVRIPDPLQCSTTKCTEVVCPEQKNECPVVTSLTVDPASLAEGETATISVDAEDPDDNPNALTTTLTANYGTIADPSASETTYACDPEVGGVIEICVVASDGDPSCDVERCTTVRCPGDPLDNTCPIIESLTSDPMTIPDGQNWSDIVVVAMDPDEFPVPMRTELEATTGVFEDRFASETTYFCGDSGPAEICVKANDGDPMCDVESCITVQCPTDIPANLCPMLFLVNAIPSRIPAGQTTTAIQTRGQDTDGLPIPLVLTLNALWGSFEDTDNIPQPNNVVSQNATYVCDRPGDVEVCVDATDGACTKTLCTNLFCPDDVPTAP